MSVHFIFFVLVVMVAAIFAENNAVYFAIACIVIATVQLVTMFLKYLHTGLE